MLCKYFVISCRLCHLLESLKVLYYIKGSEKSCIMKPDAQDLCEIPGFPGMRFGKRHQTWRTLRFVIGFMHWRANSLMCREASSAHRIGDRSNLPLAGPPGGDLRAEASNGLEVDCGSPRREGVGVLGKVPFSPGR